jgi:DNA-binding response OmpR family regulator
VILVVDDDAVYLSLTCGLLQEDGHEVVAFANAQEALEYVAHDVPTLVVCDVVMPTMDGHTFLREYRARFSDRDTPFIFLSGVSDPAQIIQALEEGATDYVPKPVDPGVLCAKVRRHLLRNSPKRIFSGELANLGFQRLVRHCEESGLTGLLEIRAPELSATIRFRAGRLDEGSISDETIGQLCELAAGHFTILSEAAVVEGLDRGEQPLPRPSSLAADPEGSHPTGRLSGIQAGTRLVQLQTQIEGESIVTVAVLDGKTLLRRQRPAVGDDRTVLEAAIHAQHEEIASEVRSKLERLLAKGSTAPQGAMERFADLYRQGIQKYEDGNYAAALMLWEMAAAIDPTNKVLLVQVEAARTRAFAGTCLDGA